MRIFLLRKGKVILDFNTEKYRDDFSPQENALHALQTYVADTLHEIKEGRMDYAAESLDMIEYATDLVRKAFGLKKVYNKEE